MKWNDYRKVINSNKEFLEAKEELKVKFALADVVLKLRLEKGWSQTELAKRTGTKQANISKIESGLSNPTLDFIQKLSLVLDFPICFENTIITKTEYSIVVVRDNEPVEWNLNSSSAFTFPQRMLECSEVPN